jgi:hypothetical protein
MPHYWIAEKKNMCYKPSLLQFSLKDMAVRMVDWELWGAAFGESQSDRFFLGAGLDSKERLSRSDG